MTKRVRYFAAWGRTWGPFDDAQVRALETSGELKELHWEWDASMNAWKPLDPAPKNPPSFGEENMSAPWLAVFEAGGLWLSGAVVVATESGCEIELDPGKDARLLPPLGAQGRVDMTLFDDEHGGRGRCAATVLGIERVGGRWLVRMQWSSRPVLHQNFA